MTAAPFVLKSSRPVELGLEPGGGYVLSVDGAPAAGATLTAFTVEGEPLALYADDLTYERPHRSPLAADGDGRFPAAATHPVEAFKLVFAAADGGHLLSAWHGSKPPEGERAGGKG